MGHFKQINVILACTTSLLGTAYTWQHLKIRLGHFEIGLDRSFVKGLLNFFTLYVPINSKVQHPPPGNPRAFELLKIVLVQFPPIGAKKPFKCPTNYY